MRSIGNGYLPGGDRCHADKYGSDKNEYDSKYQQADDSLLRDEPLVEATGRHPGHGWLTFDTNHSNH